jgi:hypothetical protein
LGDLGAGDVLGTIGGHHFAGQVEEPAAFVLVFPEMAGGEKEIEMRPVVEDVFLTLEDEARLQEGHIEGFAVVSDDRTEPALPKEFGQLLEHPLFLVGVTQEVLGHHELAVAVITQPDQKGQSARAAGQAGRLEIEEEGRAQVQAQEFLVPAEVLQRLAVDGEAVADGVAAVADLEGVAVLEILQRLSRLRLFLEYDGDLGLGCLSRPGQADELFQLVLDGGRLVPVQPAPGVFH